MVEISVAPDTVVTVSYVLSNDRGEPFESTQGATPMTYVHGYAQLVPGLERQMHGLHKGERRSFSVDPEEAFGDRDEELVLEVPKADVRGVAGLSVGDEVVLEGQDGPTLPARVIAAGEEGFVIDLNHPLAGQRVRFDVEIHDVRAASDDEIEAAQVELEALATERGPGGCSGSVGAGEAPGRPALGPKPGSLHGAEPLIQLSSKKRRRRR